MATALICESCGGPLPCPSPSAGHVTCSFCGTTSALDDRGPGPATASVAQASAVALRERYAQPLRAFETALAQQQAKGAVSREGFVAAASQTLGVLCDPQTLANVVLGLAANFGEAHGVDLLREPNALPRIATSYLAALPDLRGQPSIEIRIPMIASTARGPVDFVTQLDIAGIRALAEAKPKAPRGWFSRMFGR